MLTRGKRRAMLGASVLEEPLLMSAIVEHLSPKDVVNLTLTTKGGGFADSHRFRDTVDAYLTRERRLHELRLEELWYVSRMVEFSRKVLRLFLKAERMPHGPAKLRASDQIFTCVRDHMHLLKHNESNEPFLDIVERKLVELLENDAYRPNALNFMAEIFDIHVQTEPLYDAEDGDVEFITDRSGNVVWL